MHIYIFTCIEQHLNHGKEIRNEQVQRENDKHVTAIQVKYNIPMECTKNDHES